MQVFDIPSAALMVTEYQMMRRTCCGCGHVMTAPAPAGVTGGPAFSLYSLLNNSGFVSGHRFSDAISSSNQMPL